MKNNISKCINENCDKKDRCYRYIAEPGDQSYILSGDLENCDQFIERIIPDKPEFSPL